MSENSKPALALADKTAIALSVLCCLHCLAVPLVATFLPALMATGLGNESFHLWLVFGVIPTSAIALTWGCYTHRNLGVLAIGVVGLVVLCMPLVLGHEAVGEWGERALTMLGAVLIAISHFRNFRLCQTEQDCACA